MLSAMRAVYALVAATLMVLAFTGTLQPAIVLVLAALTGLVRPSDMGLRGALIADTMPPAIADRRRWGSRAPPPTPRASSAR